MIATDLVISAQLPKRASVIFTSSITKAHLNLYVQLQHLNYLLLSKTASYPSFLQIKEVVDSADWSIACHKKGVIRPD